MSVCVCSFEIAVHIRSFAYEFPCSGTYICAEQIISFNFNEKCLTVRKTHFGFIEHCLVNYIAFEMSVNLEIHRKFKSILIK